MTDYRKIYKDILREAYRVGGDTNGILKERTSPNEKTEIIWSAENLLKDNEISIEFAIKIAELFVADKNPEEEYDLETKNGEDTRIIATVRGTLCWLLGTLVAQFQPQYYPELFKMIEKLGDAESEKNAYVRRYAALPLSLIVRNLNAIKKQDGTDFIVPADVKEKSVALAYKMLKQNQEYPRVLEYVFSAFDGMRRVKEDEAMYILKSFLYAPDQKTLNPDYLTSHVVPLVIYFAEYRINLKDGFDPLPFQKLLAELIEESKNHLRTTLIWTFWKTIDDTPRSLEKLKPYIPLFFEKPIQLNTTHQLEYLVEKIIPRSPEYGKELFDKFLDYVIEASQLPKKELENHWLFINATPILEKIDFDSIPEFLKKLLIIKNQYGIRIHTDLKNYAEFVAKSDASSELKKTIGDFLNAFITP